MSSQRLDKESHWLDHYGSSEYHWRTFKQNHRTTFFRPLGLVETAFDVDGRHYEGRADLNAQMDLEIRSTLTKGNNAHESNLDFRERILFAWTCLRCQHLLLQARTVSGLTLLGPESGSTANLFFAIDGPRNVIQAVEDAGKHLVFLGDHYDRIDPLDFWTHCQNGARVIDPQEALAKLFIYPLESTGDGGNSTLRVLFIGAHQIWDGLTMYIWFRSFVHFLNRSVTELRAALLEMIGPEKILSRLPLPQEALYPPVTGSKARQRWFWLLTRILRHVRKPLPAGFVNPLRRLTPRIEAVPLSPSYARLLDYSKTPPLNCFPCFAKVSIRNTERLHRICREAKASVGAGCFALAALTMMEMYELREPDIPLAERKPFISGFPLNPRAFFNHHNEPDSLMLAFCDGILLPFLPSSLDLDGRLRLLARQAHRQLAVYQKRVNPAQDGVGMQYMSSRGAGRLLAIQYLGSLERMDMKLSEHLRQGMNPQGAFPARPNHTEQTCGVSSVGRRENMISQGMYDVNDRSKDFVADYRNAYANVRPRDGEFLVGVGGSNDGLWVNASVDGNSMDPGLVEQWRERFEKVLDSGNDAKKSRL